jgi:SAM-dependent methyltransferase
MPGLDPGIRSGTGSDKLDGDVVDGSRPAASGAVNGEESEGASLGGAALTELAAAYEQTQNFNSVTRWLHGRRYRHSVAVVAELAQEVGRPVRILEIGCGQAKLFGALNRHSQVRYTGIDVEPAFIEAAQRQFGHLKNFRVEVRPAQDADFLASLNRPDIVFALETFEHIPERDVMRIVETVAQLKPRRFVCSVPVEVGPAILAKNVGSWLMGYGRHREYSWRETLAAASYRLEGLPPHRRSHKGFDWRWLAQTVRHNFHHVERRHLPANWLPAALSTSVYLIARPR